MASVARVALWALFAFAALQLVQSPVTSAASPTIVGYCITAGPTTPGWPGTSGYTIENCLESAFPFVAIGLLLSFQIVALSYLIGNVLGSAAFKGWYQSELWESIKSVAVVAVIITAMIFAGSVAGVVSQNYVGQFITSPPSATQCGTTSTATLSSTENITNLYVVACNYLSGEATESNESYYVVLGAVTSSAMYESISVSWFTPILGQIPIIWPVPFLIFGSLDFGGGFKFYNSEILLFSLYQTTFVSDLFSLLVFPMMLAINAQYYLLIVLMGVGVGVLLPLGIILRAIPFLRTIGGNFIAIAIAASLLYPCMLVFFNYPLTQYFSGASQSIQGTVNGYAGSECGGFSFCSFISDALLPATAITLGVSMNNLWTGDAGFKAGYIAGSAAWNDNSELPFLSALFGYSLVPILVQFILFVVDIILIVALTQNIASLLGGEIRLGIGKMKLS